MPALYVNLMPKYQDLGYQRSSRPEQPDQRRPNKAARFPHRTEALRDSASAVSPIRFTTGTASVAAVVNSSAISYNVEASLDFSGSSSFISSAATWFSSGLSASTSNALASFGSPVSALRLNVVSGSSTGTVTASFVQAG